LLPKCLAASRLSLTVRSSGSAAVDRPEPLWVPGHVLGPSPPAHGVAELGLSRVPTGRPKSGDPVGPSGMRPYVLVRRFPSGFPPLYTNSLSLLLLFLPLLVGLAVQREEVHACPVSSLRSACHAKARLHAHLLME